MKTVALHPSIPDVENFRSVLASIAADLRVVILTEETDDCSIEVIVIWQDLPPMVANLPNLRLILVCGAGIDGILDKVAVLPHVLLARIVDPMLQDYVSDYIVMATLNHSRQWNYYMQLQRERCWTWKKKSQMRPKVGIMGLGSMGGRAAHKLQSLGFEVCGWVRGSSHSASILSEVYQGKDELFQFAQECNVLVCALPLTSETVGILSTSLFNQLQSGTYLINVGRGQHLNESDMFQALDSGQLSGACLDTFETEPLPVDHPFWTHSRITITPHIAGILLAENQAAQAAKMLSEFYTSGVLERVVDFNVQY